MSLSLHSHAQHLYTQSHVLCFWWTHELTLAIRGNIRSTPKAHVTFMDATQMKIEFLSMLLWILTNWNWLRAYIMCIDLHKRGNVFVPIPMNIILLIFWLTIANGMNWKSEINNNVKTNICSNQNWVFFVVLLNFMPFC